MELKDFTGKKMLDGVDFSSESIKSWGGSFEDCQVCRFRLDGVTYSAIEDPSDGYRSSMRELFVDGGSNISNTFEPIEVLCRHRNKSGYNQEDDILELVDATTSRVVLEVGTSKTGDYYPYYTARFDPTAMRINRGVGHD